MDPRDVLLLLPERGALTTKASAGMSVMHLRPQPRSVVMKISTEKRRGCAGAAPVSSTRCAGLPQHLLGSHQLHATISHTWQAGSRSMELWRLHALLYLVYLEQEPCHHISDCQPAT